MNDGAGIPDRLSISYNLLKPEIQLYNKNMPKLRRLGIILLIFAVLLIGSDPTYAQDSDERYFQETGHSVSGEFLTYYENVDDPLLIFGYPITDAFEDPLLGITVQYFQRARFEMHNEAAEGERVQLSDLGTLLYVKGQEVNLPIESPACQYFQERDRYVCYSFLDFYLENGGQEQFGLPVSNIEIQDDLYVQYFDRARLEWHPELPSGQRVTLTNLGMTYFDERGGDPHLLEPSLKEGIAQEVIQLSARAFVKKPVLAQNSQQTLYIVVRDQYFQPVAQSEVAVTITYPSGVEAHYKLPLTNPNGYTEFTFTVGDVTVDELVEISVEVAKGNLQDTTSTWFRMWW